jgi:hypothetical protein
VLAGKPTPPNVLVITALEANEPHANAAPLSPPERSLPAPVLPSKTVEPDEVKPESSEKVAVLGQS